MFRSGLLALRSLVARPARTLLTLFGIVLGVAVILAISITNRSTLESINAVFGEASGKAHLVITSSDTNGRGFADDTLRRVDSVVGVRLAVPTLHISTVLADDATDTQRDISFLGSVYGGRTIRQARRLRLVVQVFVKDATRIAWPYR